MAKDMLKNWQLTIDYFTGMVNIESKSENDKDDFTYASILEMYQKSKECPRGIGEGIQVNDKDKEEALKIMCQKISNAIYDYIGERNG